MLVWLTERARLKCISLFASIATPFAHTNQGWLIDFSRTHTVYCSMCCVGTRISALSWLKRSFFVIRSFQYIIFHSIFIYFMHLDLFFYVIFFFIYINIRSILASWPVIFSVVCSMLLQHKSREPFCVMCAHSVIHIAR